jgi:protein gp37
MSRNAVQNLAQSIILWSSTGAAHTIMSDGSTIEWTDATWNPVRGCTKISPGCKHCYAQTFAERWRGVPGHAYEQGFDFRLVPEKLNEPLRWSRTRRIFVNSMSDLYQDDVPEAYIDSVFNVMKSANWHIYQVLTKRAKRMREFGEKHESNLVLRKCPHIWLGVSVEDKKYGLPRINDLRKTPAAVRFLSIEPLLEDIGEVDLSGIDWVIVGGESGPGAREMKKEWVLSILRQCKAQHVRFFFKQWGGVQKKRNGRKLQGRFYSEFPDIDPVGTPPSHSVRRGLHVIYGA